MNVNSILDTSQTYIAGNQTYSSANSYCIIKAVINYCDRPYYIYMYAYQSQTGITILMGQYDGGLWSIYIETISVITSRDK